MHWQLQLKSLFPNFCEVIWQYLCRRHAAGWKRDGKCEGMRIYDIRGLPMELMHLPRGNPSCSGQANGLFNGTGVFHWPLIFSIRCMLYWNNFPISIWHKEDWLRYSQVFECSCYFLSKTVYKLESVQLTDHKAPLSDSSAKGLNYQSMRNY